MPSTPVDLLQGTLDMLILKTVSLCELHGYGIQREASRPKCPSPRSLRIRRFPGGEGWMSGSRGLRWPDALRREFRYVARVLERNPAFVLALIATLACAPEPTLPCTAASYLKFESAFEVDLTGFQKRRTPSCGLHCGHRRTAKAGARTTSSSLFATGRFLAAGEIGAGGPQPWNCPALASRGWPKRTAGSGQLQKTLWQELPQLLFVLWGAVVVVSSDRLGEYLRPAACARRNAVS
jgi:hypothetical protein